MRTMVVMLCGLFLAIPLGLSAQTADLFPANVNDTWSLHGFTGESSRVHVVSETRTGWKRFEGLFDAGLWLLPQQSRVLVWNEADSSSQVLYDFGAAAGSTWPVSFGAGEGQLTGTVTVVAKDAKVQTAFGPRTGCTTFGFLWSGLGDMGVASQSFCPGFGLVGQERLTFIGTDAEVTAAQAVNGVISTGYVGQGMNVRVDQGTAARGGMLKVRLELWDTTGTRRSFRSATTQLFDVKLLDSAGRLVRLWSSDQFFTQMETSWVLEGEEEFDLEMPLQYLDGRPLRAGYYTVEGWILDDRPRPAARTQVLVK